LHDASSSLRFCALEAALAAWKASVPVDGSIASFSFLEHPTITDVYYSAGHGDTPDTPQLGISTFKDKPWTRRNKDKMNAHFAQLIKQILLLK
jgi:hypothetical protein